MKFYLLFYIVFSFNIDNFDKCTTPEVNKSQLGNTNFKLNRRLELPQIAKTLQTYIPGLNRMERHGNRLKLCQNYSVIVLFWDLVTFCGLLFRQICLFVIFFLLWNCLKSKLHIIRPRFGRNREIRTSTLLFTIWFSIMDTRWRKDSQYYT